MLETIASINSTLNNFIWGPVMLVLLVGTGVYLTVKNHWLQIRYFGFIMKSTVGSLFHKSDAKKDSGNLSPFQAVTTALAGTVGTGNIAGVTGAIFLGGPGAIFWMWVSAFFGMCTKYAEIALALHYRCTDETGAYRGGPMYYIEKGMGKNWKWLASLFALMAGFATFGTGNLAQSSEISGAMSGLFGMDPRVTGLLLVVLSALVILGGSNRIGSVTSYMVPFMSLFYVGAGLLVIALRIEQVPAAFASILTSAFSLRAVGGGAMGYGIILAMRQGFARGVFSNEAGLGSAPMAHASSSAQEPAEQAMWGVFEVFNTILICTITALTILLSGIDLGEAALAGYASNGEAAITAFNAILPGSMGGVIIQVSLVFFSFSTILSWSYYGERCWYYLTNGNKVVTTLYKLFYIGLCFFGATGSSSLMWNIADTLNGMMAIPNLIALLSLSGVVIRITNQYFGLTPAAAEAKTKPACAKT